MLSVFCCCCCSLSPIAESFTSSYNFVCTTGSTPSSGYYVYAYPYGMTNVYLPSERFAYFNYLQDAVDSIEDGSFYGLFSSYVSSAIPTFISKYGSRPTEYYDMYVDNVPYTRIVTYNYISTHLKKIDNDNILLVMVFDKVQSYEKKNA